MPQLQGLDIIFYGDAVVQRLRGWVPCWTCQPASTKCRGGFFIMSIALLNAHLMCVAHLPVVLTAGPPRISLMTTWAPAAMLPLASRVSWLLGSSLEVNGWPCCRLSSGLTWLVVQPLTLLSKPHTSPIPAGDTTRNLMWRLSHGEIAVKKPKVGQRTVAIVPALSLPELY